VRNWDYRYSWLRDASLTLYALMTVGYEESGRGFFHWLQRAKRLDPRAYPQIVYTIDGGRDLPEVLIHDFRKNGYVPEVLLNFLALLGFSPGENIEKMTMDDMVQRFSVEGIGKSNAKFDRMKLLSFNTDFCATAPLSRLVPAFRDFLSVNPDSPLNLATDAQLGKLIDIKRGFHSLRDLDDKSRFLLMHDDDIQLDPGAVDKVLKKGDGQGLKALKDLRPLLEGISDWKHPAIEAVVNDYCTKTTLGLGKVAQPIRVAISGNTISPPIFETLEFLGKEHTLRRIDRCIAAVA
jgi:glutamyl/glutaminyl-tRNA synthetase